MSRYFALSVNRITRPRSRVLATAKSAGLIGGLKLKQRKRFVQRAVVTTFWRSTISSTGWTDRHKSYSGRAVILAMLLGAFTLQGCSLKMRPPPSPEKMETLWIRAEGVSSGGNCERGWDKARAYYGGRGIDLKYSSAAALVVMCLPAWFSFHAGGFANGDYAVVVASPFGSTHTAKTIIHEIEHLRGKEHEWGTLMSPISEALWFENGE